MKGRFPLEKFKEIETPFYYYDTSILRATLDAIREETSKYEGYEVYYAVKANANPRF